MKIIEPSVQLIHWTPQPEAVVERMGRICYKSENRIGPETSRDFIRMILAPSRKHESVMEHASAGFLVTTDRGITHEIVRHRVGVAYSQESTRYCNYSQGKHGNQITVVRPCQILPEGPDYQDWEQGCQDAETRYFQMLAAGATPQNARSVLPTCLKAEIGWTANMREWRHVLALRLAPAAHPDMRVVARMILDRLIILAPTIFEDFAPERSTT